MNYYLIVYHLLMLTGYYFLIVNLFPKSSISLAFNESMNIFSFMKSILIFMPLPFLILSILVIVFDYDVFDKASKISKILVFVYGIYYMVFSNKLYLFNLKNDSHKESQIKNN